LSGCSKKLSLPLVHNLPPTVRLTAAPVDTMDQSGQRLKYFYAYKLNWVGYDPDGRVDHFLYAIDPPSRAGSDTAWVTTTKYEQIFLFTAGIPDTGAGGVPDPVNPLAEQFHVFVIKAVDNQGLASAPVARAFFSFTQAPTCDIASPVPTDQIFQPVTPFVFIQWGGSDPDGQFTQKPVKYKFKIFKEGGPDFDFNTILQNPDSLRRYYAPRFAGWDSTGPDSAFHTFTNLVPNTRYIFAVISIDEAGAYSPIFSRNHNLLALRVSFAGVSGPDITMFNQFFNYTYPGGGFFTDPSRVIGLEVPGLAPLTFNWFATASNGSVVKQYRWVVDPKDQVLDDETPRSNEKTDITRWSQWSLGTTSATLGPYTTAADHWFYVEAEDINGLVSLGIVHYTVVLPPAVQSPLLVVNDTRLQDDQLPAFPLPGYPPDSIGTPIGGWPTRAELDTFLFARGGAPWRWSPPNPVDPTQRWKSPPGIFAGYPFDTIYTRTATYFSSVPLSDLVKYRHIVWFAEPLGASGALVPIDALGAMSKPGQANTLAAYVTLGGRVWMCGGACASATLLGLNVNTNGATAPVGVAKFWSTGTKPALQPGRMMYDQVHWRSQFWATGVSFPIVYRSPRAVAGRGSAYPSDPPPDYSRLPQRIRLKSAAEGDPLYPYYPWRTNTDMYLGTTNWNVEAMPGTLPPSQDPMASWNVILENFSTNPDSTDLEPALDTLMAIRAFPFPAPQENLNDPLHFYENVIMTYYHGLENGPLFFSGFDIWSGNRGDLAQLVDFVMGIWGVPKSATPAASAFARPAPTPAARFASTTDRRAQRVRAALRPARR
jgi:hypothetical protein